MFGAKAWRGHGYDLGRMTLRELLVAYLTYPTILLYYALAALGFAATLWLAEPGRWPWVLLSVAATGFFYPFLEYGLHRFVLHNRALYKSPLTAKVWKRIHFDHHQDPHRLEVLFGSVDTLLPTVVIATLPIGWAIEGAAGAAASLTTGLLFACFYEYCHCLQHLNVTPKSRWLARIKQRHLAHHFHYEKGNFGITTHVLDHAFGTFYGATRDVPKSPTAFNLGYDEAEALRYPWVARLSGGPPRSRPPGGGRGAEAVGAGR